MNTLTMVPTTATNTPTTAASATAAQTTSGAMLDERFGLALMEGEKVLVEGKPQRDRMFRYQMLTAAIVLGLTGVGLLLLPIIYLVVRASVAKHNYWVTSSRVVVTNGVIGFNARSIPLERV
ncbi:MAG: hypothetical protein K0V04_18670, partial [Deltaproteobacteria bacterium]|nr:hypothetical protein [Deltaproteobacteria bacterium]